MQKIYIGINIKEPHLAARRRGGAGIIMGAARAGQRGNKVRRHGNRFHLRRQKIIKNPCVKLNLRGVSILYGSMFNKSKS